jgi:hypothetical protein
MLLWLESQTTPVIALLVFAMRWLRLFSSR